MSVPRPRELVSVAAVISIALVVLVFCLTHRNSISYGPGPDPFDYITTAHHLVDHGTLRFTNTVAQGLDIDPRYNVYFVPEPFVILPPGQTYASLYPPGTSLLMALSLVTVGDIGPYLLGPVLAAGCVILIALLAYSLFGAAGAVTAASLLAACPIFLAPARAPLSDIPALFFVLLSLVLLSAGRPTTAVIAGLAFGMAVMIRLNLAVILPATMLWGLSQAPRSRRLGHLFAFAAGVAPGIVLLGGINAFLYGSPLTSGYALKTDFHDPFSLAFSPRHSPAGCVPWLWAPGR